MERDWRSRSVRSIAQGVQIPKMRNSVFEGFRHTWLTVIQADIWVMVLHTSFNARERGKKNMNNMKNMGWLREINILKTGKY